jgi:hypothetical protein
MPVVAPYLPYDRLRAAADDFLREHHPSGELPVPIEKIVEFRFGLDIVPVPGLQDGFDVDAYITSDLSEIRVDRFIQQKRPTRYRFSLAHELAHLIIHQEVFAQLKFSTIEEWKAVISSIPEQQYGFIEWQAYCLGGLILVPPKPLKEIFEVKVKEASAAGLDLYEVDEDYRKIVHNHIGGYFDVSGDVIKRRMKYDGLWQR